MLCLLQLSLRVLIAVSLATLAHVCQGAPAHLGRSLKQAPCSLEVAGAAYTFDSCPEAAASNSAVQLFYSLLPAAASNGGDGGGVVLRGGIRAQGTGWAGWGLGSSGMMPGTKTVVVKTDSSTRTGASVSGYVLPGSILPSAINAAAGTWALTDAVAALEPDGSLVAVFTAVLPDSVSGITAAPYPYIWATGAVSSSSGNILTHFEQGSGQLSFAAPAVEAPSSPGTATAGAPAEAVPTVEGGGGAGEEPAAAHEEEHEHGHEEEGQGQEGEAEEDHEEGHDHSKHVGQENGREAGTSTTSAQGCSLSLGGAGSAAPQSFPSCASLSALTGSHFSLMWRVLPAAPTGPGRRLRQYTVPMLFGLNGTTDGRGYLAFGFPSQPGEMVDSDAFILQDCDSCPSGALLRDYYLSSMSQAGVNSPSRLAVSNVAAARTPGAGAGAASWLSGSFVVELPAALLASPTASLIFAAGPVSRTSGAPLHHDFVGSGEVGLGLQGGVGGDGAADLDTGDDAATKKQVHAWLMTISWGLLVPVGIVMARSFKELDPAWFIVHRAIQTLAFLAGVAGFVVGFTIRGTWDTPYTVHRNLGIAVMAGGAAQMTALLARPLKTSRWRRPWNFAHHWLGRAAAACAAANIYYGIIHVEHLGSWAWASYTAALGTIVAVALVKDSMDYCRGRRALGPFNNSSQQKLLVAEEATGQPSKTTRQFITVASAASVPGSV